MVVGRPVGHRGKSMSRKLTIQIDGKADGVDVGTFAEVLNKTLHILRSIDCAMTEERTPAMLWHVSNASMRSPLSITITGSPRAKRDLVDVVRPFMDGLRAIDKTSCRPEHFSDSTLEAAKSLVAVLNNGVAALSYSSGRTRVQPTQHVAAHVDTVLGKTGRFYEVEDAQLEGRLEQLTVHGPPTFGIYDPISGTPVRCQFDEDRIDEAIALIRARVRVTGMVRYNKKHVAVSVRVTNFVRLREQSELPQLSDLHKAGVNITGGQDSVAFVRDMRDE